MILDPSFLVKTGTTIKTSDDKSEINGNLRREEASSSRWRSEVCVARLFSLYFTVCLHFTTFIALLVFVGCVAQPGLTGLDPGFPTV